MAPSPRLSDDVRVGPPSELGEDGELPSSTSIFEAMLEAQLADPNGAKPPPLQHSRATRAIGSSGMEGTKIGLNKTQPVPLWLDDVSVGKPVSMSADGQPVLPSSTAIFEARMAALVDHDATKAKPDQNLGEIPLISRLTSPKWELRNHAYGEIKSKVETNDGQAEEIVSTYKGEIATWIGDKNVNAQLRGVEAAIAVVSRDPAPEQTWRDSWNILREKVLLNGKVQAAGVEFVLRVAQTTGPDMIIEDIVAFLDKQINPKKPGAAVKGVAAKQTAICLSLLFHLVHEFGIDQIKIGSFLSKAQKFGVSTDKALKDALYDLLYEIFLWTRSVESVKAGLEEKQKAEIERRCASVPAEMPKPLRRFKGQGAAPAEAGSGATVSTPSGDTLYELSEEVDILESLGPVDVWERAILEAEKWQEKRDLLQQLITLCEKNAKIKNHPEFAHVASLLLRLIKTEGNIVLVSMAIKCQGLLALGLRKDFAAACKNASQTLIAKMKDKNRSILQSAITALDAFLCACSFDAFIEECEKNLKEKGGPRQHVLDWCLKVLSHPNQLSKREKYAERFVQFTCSVIEDPNQGVRYSAARLLYVLEEILGNRAIQTTVDSFPPKVKKVVDGFDLKRHQSVGEPKTPVKATTPTKADSLNLSDRVSLNLSPCATTATAASDALLESSYEAADAEKVAEEVLPSHILVPLKSNIWKDKAAGLDELKIWWETNPDVASSHAEPLIVFVKKVVKDFKENNVHVYRSALQLLLVLPQLLKSAFSKILVATILRSITEKVVDVKLGPSVVELILLYSESFAPQFSLNVILPAVKASTNSKLHAEVGKLIGAMLSEFGVNCIALRTGADVCQLLISSDDEATAAIGRGLAVRLYANHGESIMKLIQASQSIGATKMDALKALIGETKRLDALPGTPPRKFRDQTSPSTAATSAGSASSSSKPGGGTTPRSRQSVAAGPVPSPLRNVISPDLVRDMQDSEWKVRKESIETITKSIRLEYDSAGTLGVNGTALTDLLIALRARLSEPNKNVLKEAIICVSLIGEVLAHSPGGQARNHAKHVLVPLFFKFSEKASHIREPLGIAVENWLKAGGTATYVALLVTSNALMEPLSDQREGLLGTLVNSDADMSQCDMASLRALVPMLVETLQDNKSKYVRVLSKRLLDDVSRLVGPSVMNAAICKLKPCEKRALTNVVAKYTGESADNAVDDSESEYGGSALGSSYSSATSGVRMGRPRIGHGRSVSGTLGGRSHHTRTSSNKEWHSGTTGNMRASPKRNRNTPILRRQGTGPLQSPSNEFSKMVSFDSYIVKVSPLTHNRRSGVRDSTRPSVLTSSVSAPSVWPIHLRSDDVDALQAAWRLQGNESLVSAMFAPSTNFSKTVKACEFWKAFVANSPHHNRLFGSDVPLLELLLKWATVKLAETNPKVQFSTIEFVRVLLQEMETNGYQLAESEVNIIASHLVERVGSNNQAVRDKIRDLLHQVFTVSPPQCMFVCLLRGTSSSNKRSVVETLDIIGSLMEAHGPSVLSHNIQKDAVKLASLTHHSNDRQVINSALRAVVALYQFIGPTLYTYCGSHSPDLQEKVDRAIRSSGHLADGAVSQNFTALSMGSPSPGQVGVLPDSFASHVSHTPPHDVPKRMVSTPQPRSDTLAVPPASHSRDVGAKRSRLASPSTSVSRWTSSPRGSGYRSSHSPSGGQSDGPGRSSNPSSTKARVTSALAAPKPPKKVRDYVREYEEALVDNGAEMLLQDLRLRVDLLEDRIGAQHTQLELGFLSEVCRRGHDGYLETTENEALGAQCWMRVNEARREGSVSVTMMLVLHELRRPSIEAIGESSRRLTEMLEAHSDKVEWPSVFAGEVSQACASALEFCFSTERVAEIQNSPGCEMTHVHFLAKLISKFTKHRRVLVVLSPIQLTHLMKELLRVMSLHETWKMAADADELVESLNAIIGQNLLNVTSPRTAPIITRILSEFLLCEREYLDEGLIFRVFRRFIKRLNMKHIDVALPTTSASDSRNYVRILEACLHCLKWIVCREGEELSGEFRKKYEDALRELIYVVTVVSPDLVGVYFRDTAADTDACSDAFSSTEVQFRFVLEKLMNPPTTSTGTSPLHKGLNSSVGLNDSTGSVGKKTDSGGTGGSEVTSTQTSGYGSAPLTSASSYRELNAWHRSSGSVFKLTTPPQVYPIFSITQLSEDAPRDMKLKEVDPVMAHGWASVRSTSGTGSDSMFQRAPQMKVKEWQRDLRDIAEKVGAPSVPLAEIRRRYDEILREDESKGEVGQRSRAAVNYLCDSLLLCQAEAGLPVYTGANDDTTKPPLT
eukprot:GHVN01078991.1.p1 GENE.GHVN01078991.1~~GHVN01078991.1.p1  ORF type:complete len:2409 (-),score=377.84 GHVN01078991.1:96-7022(-)